MIVVPAAHVNTFGTATRLTPRRAADALKQLSRGGSHSEVVDQECAALAIIFAYVERMACALS